MYYILKISNEAFVKIESDLTIVQEPKRATKIEKIGDAMAYAAKINNSWKTNIVKVIRLN